MLGLRQDFLGWAGRWVGCTVICSIRSAGLGPLLSQTDTPNIFIGACAWTSYSRCNGSSMFCVKKKIYIYLQVRVDI